MPFSRPSQTLVANTQVTTNITSRSKVNPQAARSKDNKSATHMPINGTARAIPVLQAPTKPTTKSKSITRPNTPLECLPIIGSQASLKRRDLTPRT